MNENYISGFATEEYNIQNLKDPGKLIVINNLAFKRYFTVNSPEAISEYTKL